MTAHQHARSLLPALLVLLILATPALAIDNPKTWDQQDLSLDGLKALLAPLTKTQLEEQAENWQGELQKNLLDAARKETTDEQRTKLGQAKAGLVQRLEAVLAELEKKGGDGAEYRTWLALVAPDDSTISLSPEQASELWNTIYGWAISAEGGIKWAVKIVLFPLTLLAFKILAAILGKITRKAVNAMKKTSMLLRDFFVNMVRKITFFIGLIVALSMIDVNVGPFVAAIGAIGFIIAFALQGTLSNFASGIMILLYRPYDIGDVVTISGVTGKVNAMSLVSTTVMTPDNQLVVIPNDSIWGGIITNITGSSTRRIDHVFGIGYGDDIAKAEGILMKILEDHELILKDPAPVVQVHELADSSVNFVVRPWVRTADYWTVYWDVTRQVKERFDEAGVSIPFPQQDVHMHQETAAE